MSSVLKRFRGESDFQLVVDARKLRGELLSWCNNTKNIPMRYRWEFVPIIFQNLDILCEELKDASKYPKDKEMLRKRREHISKAMEADKNIWKKLQALYDLRMAHGGMSLKTLEPILDELHKLFIDMKSWKKAGLPRPK